MVKNKNSGYSRYRVDLSKLRSYGKFYLTAAYPLLDDAFSTLLDSFLSLRLALVIIAGYFAFGLIKLLDSHLC